MTAQTADPATIIAAAGHDLLVALAQIVDGHQDLLVRSDDVAGLLDQLTRVMRRVRGRVNRAAKAALPAKAPATGPAAGTAAVPRTEQAATAAQGRQRETRAPATPQPVLKTLPPAAAAPAGGQPLAVAAPTNCSATPGRCRSRWRQLAAAAAVVAIAVLIVVAVLVA
jgi:hypothetical protein